jgi:hypothetical protein
MTVCAVIDKTNTVINLIIADPVDTPPSECLLALKPDNIFVDLGYTWDGYNFFDQNGIQSLPIYEE